MGNNATRIGLLSDFNCQNLETSIRKNSGNRDVTCINGPFAHTTSVLLDGAAPFWTVSYDAIVIWTMPARAVPTLVER